MRIAMQRPSPSLLAPLPMLLTALAVALWFNPGVTSRLQYDRSVLATGEWWRMLTCHWTHFSADQLAWDAGVFALLATICQCRSPTRFLVCLILSAAAVSSAVWLFLLNLQRYRGLSGIDSALFTMLAVDLLRHHLGPEGRREIAQGIGIVLAMFIGKIAVEFIWETTVFVDSRTAGMVPVPLAHGVGAIVGLVCSGRNLLPQWPRQNHLRLIPSPGEDYASRKVMCRVTRLAAPLAGRCERR